MKRNTTIFTSTLVLSISLIASSALISNAVSVPTIKACAVKKTGDLRLITGSAKCKKTERLITWGTKGSTGVRGPAGPAGPAVAPNVTTVDDTVDGWTSIHVPIQTGWDTISLMQSEPLAAGDYLVLANVEILTGNGSVFCAATTTANEVGASGTYRSVPKADTTQYLSFSRHVSVVAGERMHLRCAGSHLDSEAVDGLMTLIPVT